MPRNGSQRFRRRLAARILCLAGSASVTAAYAACDGGGKGAGGASSASSSSTSAHSSAGTGGAGDASSTGGAGGATEGGTRPLAQSCLVWPPAAGTGGGGTGGAGGEAGAPDAAADAMNAGADAGPCPTDPMVVLMDFVDLGCPHGWEPSEIVSGPTAETPGQCCYQTYLALCSKAGRPYLAGDGARVAALASGPRTHGWSRTETDAPGLDGLTDGERAALARAWTADALAEHASVASFSRFSLALLAAGAPAELVELAHLAALDEIHHARLCFALASAYAGEAVAPGPFPLGGNVPVGASLAELAVSTVLEGCVGETVAAAVAAEQLAGATDPAVRAVLARIAADEARHAELAWRTVAWAVRTGGDEVRAAVARAFASAVGSTPPHEAPDGEAGSRALAAHGRLDAATVASVAAALVVDVVAPAARALLGPPSAGAVPARARVPRRADGRGVRRG